MYVWERRLYVRLRGAEAKLYNQREGHYRLVKYRKKFEPGTDGHVHCSKAIAIKQREINKHLDEIAFLKALIRMGPLVGREVWLQTSPGAQTSVTLIHLIEREIEKDNGEQLAPGLEKALEIMYNPREFLTDEEKEQYDRAVKQEYDEQQRHERLKETAIAPINSVRISEKAKPPKKSKKPVHEPPMRSVRVTLVNGIAKVVE